MNNLKTLTLGDPKRLQITVCNLGAGWHSCLVPIAGKKREVILGSQNPLMNLENGAYLGATVGRYAGRIANGKYRRKGKTQQMRINQAPHCLHGGVDNFSRRFWTLIDEQPDCVTFSLFSPHGDEGFAGNLSVKTRYQVTDNAVIIDWFAETDRETVVNLTNHAYFNLNGDPDNINAIDGLQQYLQIDADYFVPVNTQGIPSARKKVVANSMDFRQEKLISPSFLKDHGQRLVAGYDHSYLLNSHTKPQAKLSSHTRDICLYIHTTQPAIHIYSGQYLHGTPNRHGGTYANHAGIAIETQAPPDSPNRRYALVRLKPAQRYHQQTRYEFVSI